MKKTIFSIGRDPSSDIVLYDPTNVVSREHATLRIQSGKYYITDHSTNGTYKNGIRLSPEIEYQISKYDNIVFGDSVRLDWRQVPKGEKSAAIWIVLACLLFIAAILAGCYFLLPRKKLFNDKVDNAPAVVVKDTVKLETPKEQLVRLENVKQTKAKKADQKVGKKDMKNYKDEDDNPSKPVETPTQQSDGALDPL